MLSMRGFIPVCIIIQPEFSLTSRRKIYGLALLTLKWMKKWRAEAGGNEFFYKTTMKETNKFNLISGGTS
jgi:hypothetical protein